MKLFAQDNSNQKCVRAFELDLLRGVAIVMMILHHIIYDIRYIFNIDAFAWQESYFFIYWLRPLFVFIFLFVSGVCCTFSRSNFKRSIKLAVVAALFSLVFYIFSVLTKTEMYVVFNVIAVLATGTLVYAIFESLEKRKIIKNIRIPLLVSTVFILWLQYPLSNLQTSPVNIFVPLHEVFTGGFGMGDYMPIIPWIGLFFFGAFIGKTFYQDKTTKFPNTPVTLLKIIRPFEFVGKYALFFYVFHQPVVLLILFGLRALGII